MPATPPTQAQLDALQAAIYSGVLEVEYDGPPRRRVRYQSIPHMQAVLAQGISDLAAASGASMSRFAVTRKGT